MKNGKGQSILSGKRYPGLTNLKKNLYLAIIDDFPDNVPIMYMMDANSPINLIPMLRWLAVNKVTGKKFYDFFYGDMEGSPLKLFVTLNAKIEREKHERPLFAGRDF